MSKRTNKLLSIISVVILLTFALVSLIGYHNESTAFYAVSDKQNFGSAGSFLSNKNLYCLNHGKEYVPYATYYCYDVGTASKELSYIIAQQKDGTRNSETDLVANAVWVLAGEEHSSTPPLQGTAELNDLLARAELAASIKDSGNISITGPNSPVIETTDGKYGPFKITYPSYNGKVFAVTTGGAEIPADALVIKVNGQELTNIPASGQEFYLTENDGIKHGQKNVIEVFYNGYKVASSNYAKFSPEREITRRGTCGKCGGEFIFVARGFCVGNKAYDVPPMSEWDVDPRSEGHLEEDCTGPINVERTVYYRDNYQNLIYITPMYDRISENEKFEFWAGKPNIEIDIDKVDTSNKAVGGVTFNVSVENGKIKDGSNSITTGNDGKANITIEPNPGATRVIVTLEETNAPANYIKYKSPIKLIYDWNSSSKQWSLTSIEKPENEKIEGKLTSVRTGLDDCTNVFLITAVNRPIIRVIVKKTDVNLDNITANGNPLKDIKFNISITGGKINTEHEESKGVTGNTLITDASGEGVIIIEPNPGVTTVNLTLTEETSIYYEPNNPINITFTYNDMIGQWTTQNVALNNNNLYQVTMQNESKCEVVIKNKAIIQKLKLLKINAFITDEVIPDITFRIQLENARTKSGSSSIVRSTDASGEIDLGELEVIDPSKNIIVTLEEIGVPQLNVNFRGLYPNGRAEIIFKHKEGNCRVTVTGANNNSVDAEYNTNDNTVKVTVENMVTLDLSGKVWEDKQHGIKPVTAPNGSIDSDEAGIPNIEVSAINSAGVVVATTVTDANGYYEFKDLPASIRGTIKYYIEFTFDGIHYIVTPYSQQSGDSVVQEINRNQFNSRFETITKGKSNDGTTLEYDYTTDPEKALLIVRDSSGKLLEKFAMKSTTLANIYSENTANINMGLVRKEVDLAAVTDIYQAKVSINGKEKIYNYNDIQNLQKDENNNPILEPLQIENVRYNLYLYDSDYNYRIGDYKLPAARNNELAVNTMAASSNLLQQRQNDGDLNIEVTYQILLNNQSSTDTKINNIAYYYDPHYILSGATPELVTINGKAYNKVILNTNAVFNDTVNQGVAELVFTVGKDEQGRVYTGDFQNWVEIISYSTNEGCIDIDSAPDNIEIHSKEDDTDDAAGLAIQLNNLQREIKGFVFEDAKTTTPGSYNTGNGQYDNGENKVDDVIVQLIEVKNVSVGNKALKLEYIWQETESGSNVVRYVTSDGQSQGEYTVSNESGSYTFKGFIPGNYIVRFIYGDGTYYDADSAGNLTKYNGQDYKSTIDAYYNKVWYEPSSYQQNNSMARDNEARRLEEIGFAKSVAFSNADQLKIDSKDKLDNTWMCAETSTIWMDVSENPTDGDSSQTMQRNVNFGLAQRSLANLVLEKHITSLKIDDVTEAITSIENYDDHNKLTVKLDSNTGKSVFATATDKEENSRGIWKVEEQTEKLGGKGIYITYTFRITNVGDIEYIGRELSNQLASGKTYAQIAEELKRLSYDANYNTQGLYLGTAYYNGTKSDSDVDSEIPFQIEDYVSTSNGLKLNTTNNNFVTVDTNKPKYIWDYKTLSTNEKVATDEKTENVDIVQSKDVIKLGANKQTKQALEVYNESLDSVNGRKDFTYRSYAAQLIYPTSGSITSDAGTLSRGIGLGNLKTVQSYVDDLDSVPIIDITPEPDEFIAETVIVTMPTGGEDKAESSTMLIVSIAIGVATLAIGIVLIKKFAIK